MTDVPDAEDTGIEPINIEEEMQRSYLGYAMSVIVGRALPSVCDGLKPVHRRVLYSMHRLNLTHGSKHKKCAAITGDVMGRYHPHGDKAIYDAVVRMAQDFSLRYPLVDGQGNFGSVDGDAPAAMRYTEARMTRIAEYMLEDIARDTVDFVPNYDGSLEEPVVLPARIPQLLVNGSSGIAVGMATSIPPHNLTEISRALLALLDNPALEERELFEMIPGPDFPTAGIIMGRGGILDAYTTGRGRVVIRARCEIQTKGNRQRIIITEIPYKVNKSRLLQHIGELVREKKISGITSLSDDSDRRGLQISIDVSRSQSAEVLLNQLFQLTKLQDVFGIQLIALENGEPKAMTLRQLLESFLTFRREVVTRRSVFDLRRHRRRIFILEGMAVAIEHIDKVVELIKSSADPAAAKAALLEQRWLPGGVREMLKLDDEANLRPDDIPAHCGFQPDHYRMSPAQAQAILDMKLVRLTGLEQGMILKEYVSLAEKIRELLAILTNPGILRSVIRSEIEEVLDLFGDERRTEISNEMYDLAHEDLIEDEPCLVTLSDKSYISIRDPEEYRTQRRGGRGARAAQTREEEQIAQMLPAMTKDTLLFFTNLGRVYSKRVFEIPRGSRTSRGRPLNNLIEVSENEHITAMLPIREFDPDRYIVMVTRSGQIKRTSLSEFVSIRRNGKIAITLREDDSVVDADLVDGLHSVFLTSSGGLSIRFAATDVRAMGRTAAGVRGIRLRPEQHVVKMLCLREDT
nr:DNA gyrase subunit A [Gammaproteobacteria bacterium]